MVLGLEPLEDSAGLAVQMAPSHEGQLILDINFRLSRVPTSSFSVWLKLLTACDRDTSVPRGREHKMPDQLGAVPGASTRSFCHILLVKVVRGSPLLDSKGGGMDSAS